MFVQSAHFIEHGHKSPQDAVTFYGMEKNPTTIRLAKMNLAVHGLEGNIQKAISYYEDPHNFLGRADYVMANPPFNVDDVDAEKIKNDPRIPFGLPGVNKKGAVSNGNYLWMSYFYSYLNDQGRAGFVMSSQASSAGGEEAKVRRKMIETGHVDAMIAIRGNFFYTRTVPCELWFFDKSKPEAMKDKVLMVDARNVFRKVTRKIYDFSPEQAQNLAAIFWLYRGQQDRFLSLIGIYLTDTIKAAEATTESLHAFYDTYAELFAKVDNADNAEVAYEQFIVDVSSFDSATTEIAKKVEVMPKTNAGLAAATSALEPLAETSRDLIKQIDQVFKLIEKQAKNQNGGGRGLNQLIKGANEARGVVVEALRQVRNFHKQARWLQERFPNAVLREVKGLVKLVDHAELEANDWSLTPGRYVGVAPEEEDEGFDFEEALRDIHIELTGLNEEAVELATKIQKNFKELGV